MAPAVAVNRQNISDFPQTVNDASGVLAFCALVAGTAENQVKRPAAANASKFIGVADHDAANGEDVSVIDKGIVYMRASAAVIAVGDYVNVADTTGRVKTAGEAANTANVLGIARSATTGTIDQYVKVLLQPQLR